MKKREELTPETIMETGKQLRESLLAVLSPEERLAGLAPEERLAGLTAEELVALMGQIDAYLRKQQSKTQSTQTETEPN